MLTLCVQLNKDSFKEDFTRSTWLILFCHQTSAVHPWVVLIFFDFLLEKEIYSCRSTVDEIRFARKVVRHLTIGFRNTRTMDNLALEETMMLNWQDRNTSAELQGNQIHYSVNKGLANTADSG